MVLFLQYHSATLIPCLHFSPVRVEFKKEHFENIDFEKTRFVLPDDSPRFRFFHLSVFIPSATARERLSMGLYR